MDINQENSEQKHVAELVNEGIVNGAIIPLERAIFGEDDLHQAFKALSNINQMSKVTIKIRDEELQSVVKPSPKFFKTNSSVRLYPTKTYVLIGDFNRTSTEIVYWLITRGATKIAFATHGSIYRGYQSFHTQQWRENNVDLLFYDYDCTTKSGTHNLLQKASSMGPVGGIFHLEQLSQNNESDHNSSGISSSTVTTIENLDSISRTNCPSLDYFVIFSFSTTSHETNNDTFVKYSCAASERICENRREDGYPSVSVQWENLETMPLPMLVSYLSCLDQLLQCADPIFIVSTANESNAENEKIEDKSELLSVLRSTFSIKVTESMMKNTLLEVGLDSLMIAELQQILQRKFSTSITANDMQTMTLSQFVEIQTRNTK